MKKIVLIIAVLFTVQARAQITNVSLQASGLTCSMCSNAINKSLQSLDNVEKVMANISTSTFSISFKDASKINFDELKKKVEDAGFFVANLTAEVNFKQQKVEKDEHLNYAGMTFHFLNTKGQVLDGTQKIQIVDNGFVPAKQFKKNQSFTKMDCYKTGVAASCCTKSGLAAGTRIYHVTI